MTTITYDDFAARDQWSGGKWYKHSVADADLRDAAAARGLRGQRSLSKRVRFTLTRRNPHDNVKALVYSTAAFSLRRARPGDASKRRCASRRSAPRP